MRLRRDRMYEWARTFIRTEKGAVAILVALATPVLFGAAALGIDASRLYVTKTKLQDAADAAAFGGVQLLPDEPDVDVRSRAKMHGSEAFYAENRSDDENNILKDEDIWIGRWPPVTDESCAKTQLSDSGPGGDDNAVKVVTRRSEQNGNPVGLLFAPVLALVDGAEGRKQSDVTACAIAIVEQADSTNSIVPCMTARGDVIIGGSTAMNLPKCGIEARNKLNLKGNAVDVTVGRVAYKTYDGKKGNSTPEDDFNESGSDLIVEELSGNQDPDNPTAPSGATRVSDVCDVKKGKVKGTCDLRSKDAYVIDSDMEFAGNTELLFRESEQGKTQKPTKLFVDGEFKIRGNAQITGCFELAADTIDINGNPFVGNACENFEPANGSGGTSGPGGKSTRLVQ